MRIGDLLANVVDRSPCLTKIWGCGPAAGDGQFFEKRGVFGYESPAENGGQVCCSEVRC